MFQVFAIITSMDSVSSNGCVLVICPLNSIIRDQIEEAVHDNFLADESSSSPLNTIIERKKVLRYKQISRFVFIPEVNNKLTTAG